jgi:mono/diheme cytochrome c family protein
MTILRAILVTIGGSAALMAAVIYTGIYDIGADAPHWDVTSELVELVRERSIAARIGTIAPPALDDPRLIAEGGKHYAAMCSGCHLAPGLADTELRIGLYPRPPDLTRDTRGHAHADAKAAAKRHFRIIKHGIKLTAMPAWGTTHGDASIWALVAFVDALPRMSVRDYEEMTGATGTSAAARAATGVDHDAEHGHRAAGAHAHGVHE